MAMNIPKLADTKPGSSENTNLEMNSHKCTTRHICNCKNKTKQLKDKDQILKGAKEKPHLPSKYLISIPQSQDH